MPKRKAYAVVRLTITREFEFEADDETEEAFNKSLEAAIEEKHGKLVGDGSDNPDEYDILFSDWDE